MTKGMGTMTKPSKATVTLWIVWGGRGSGNGEPVSPVEHNAVVLANGEVHYQNTTIPGRGIMEEYLDSVDHVFRNRAEAVAHAIVRAQERVGECKRALLTARRDVKRARAMQETEAD